MNIQQSAFLYSLKICESHYDRGNYQEALLVADSCLLLPNSCDQQLKCILLLHQICAKSYFQLQKFDGVFDHVSKGLELCGQTVPCFSNYGNYSTSISRLGNRKLNADQVESVYMLEDLLVTAVMKGSSNVVSRLKMSYAVIHRNIDELCLAGDDKVGDRMHWRLSQIHCIQLLCVVFRSVHKTSSDSIQEKYFNKALKVANYLQVDWDSSQNLLVPKPDKLKIKNALIIAYLIGNKYVQAENEYTNILKTIPENGALYAQLDSELRVLRSKMKRSV
jgi:tetratricopeptide (TPR) repeat protein